MSFGSDLTKIANKLNQTTDKVVRSIVIEWFSSTVKDTPVDTGRARANWQITDGVPASGTLEKEDKEGASTIANIFNKVKSGKIQFLTNNLPYILPLEYGSSKKGSHMVSKNFSRIQRIVKEKAQENKA